VHVCDHEGVIARFVDEHLVGGVVANLIAVQVPGDLGVRSAGHSAVKACHLALSCLAVGADTQEIRGQAFAAVFDALRLAKLQASAISTDKPI
jgi:hypothetical protein